MGMVRIQFLSSSNVLQRQMLLNLPIPAPNKTPVTFKPSWKADLIKIFTRLPHGVTAPKPLGFSIFRFPQVLNLVAVQWGHPFTLGVDTIVFPANFLQKSSALYKKTVIIHELVHLHQRRNPQLYYQYYVRQGFVRARVVFDEWLQPLLMFNPDGEQYEWVWQHGARGYIPFAIGHRTYVSVVEDWTPLPHGRLPVVHVKTLQPVEEVSEYYHSFRNKHQMYHPNEIVAHEITDALFP